MIFNHFLHKNSKLQENSNSRSILPFYYAMTLTARVLDSDLGILQRLPPSSTLDKDLFLSTADAASHLVTAVSLLQAALALILPISISDEPVCVHAWVYVCLCEFTVNISTVCIPLQSELGEVRWRKNDFLAQIWLCRNSPALLFATVHSYSLHVWIVPSDHSRRGILCS